MASDPTGPAKQRKAEPQEQPGVQAKPDPRSKTLRQIRLALILDGDLALADDNAGFDPYDSRAVSVKHVWGHRRRD